MKVLLTTLLSVIISVTLGLLIAFPVMWLWNYVIPDIFGLPTIVFWQAFALYILSNILAKGVSTTVTKN
jgi:hypothetical protein|tara:strand:- start:396 stop:602 length:207 start_codon:yes stop_codon:yes gene_type:complete